MMMNRKNRKRATMASAYTWLHVKSESSSLIVGRSVKVKIVASMADQNSSSRNAIHGTPGWRELESSIAKGDVTRLFRVLHANPTPSRRRPQIHPTNTRRKRARPNQ